MRCRLALILLYQRPPQLSVDVAVQLRLHPRLRTCAAGEDGGLRLMFYIQDLSSKMSNYLHATCQPSSTWLCAYTRLWLRQDLHLGCTMSTWSLRPCNRSHVDACEEQLLCRTKRSFCLCSMSKTLLTLPVSSSGLSHARCRRKWNVVETWWWLTRSVMDALKTLRVWRILGVFCFYDCEYQELTPECDHPGWLFLNVYRRNEAKLSATCDKQSSMALGEDWKILCPILASDRRISELQVRSLWGEEEQEWKRMRVLGWLVRVNSTNTD